MKFKVATAQPKSDSNILQTVGWSSQAMPMAVERRRCSVIQARERSSPLWIKGRHVRRPQLKSALCLIADVWHRELTSAKCQKQTSEKGLLDTSSSAQSAF